MFDFDFDFQFDPEDKKTVNSVNSVAIKRNPKTELRRAFSEKKLLELLGKEIFNRGESWHIISGGNIDALSFLKHIINQQSLDYCLFSTWCMALDDVFQFEEWIEQGKINRLDAYVGEIFPKSYEKEFVSLKPIVEKTGGRIAVFRNHAKVFAGTGKEYDFCIESSANINTNPRSENTVISIDDKLFDFYKTFYDGIKSFNRDFDNWKPWETK